MNFNIAADPGEEQNLAEDNPTLVVQLDALIEQHLIDTEALQPVANPNYVPPVFDGWMPNKGVWVQDGNAGRIKMVSNSFLPALDSPDLSALAVPAKVLVRMTSRSYGDGCIWWKFPGDTEWLPAQSESFAVTHDSVERVIEIPIAPGAPVAQLRYQPSSGYFQTEVLYIHVLDAADNLIESMSLMDGDIDGDGTSDEDELAVGREPENAADMAFHFNTDADFEGWNQDPRNISGFMVSNGVIKGTALTPDPHFEKHSVRFISSAIPAVSMRMRAGANASVQFFWAPEGGGFVGNFVSKTYTGNGDWQVVELSLAGNSGWDGETIDKLRVDPIGSANAWFEIDWIRAVNGDADNDGFPDSDEDIAGTDRLDPAENGLFISESSLPVRVEGKAGRLYSLQWSQNLISNDWETVEASGPLLLDGMVAFTNGAPATNGFYRVRVEFPE